MAEPAKIPDPAPAKAPVTVPRVPSVNVAPITPDIGPDDPGINHHIVYG